MVFASVFKGHSSNVKNTFIPVSTISHFTAFAIIQCLYQIHVCCVRQALPLFMKASFEVYAAHLRLVGRLVRMIQEPFQV